MANNRGERIFLLLLRALVWGISFYHLISSGMAEAFAHNKLFIHSFEPHSGRGVESSFIRAVLSAF